MWSGAGKGVGVRLSVFPSLGFSSWVWNPRLAKREPSSSDVTGQGWYTKTQVIAHLQEKAASAQVWGNLGKLGLHIFN